MQTTSDGRHISLGKDLVADLSRVRADCEQERKERERAKEKEKAMMRSGLRSFSSSLVLIQRAVVSVESMRERLEICR